MSEINQNPPSTFELTGVNLESNPKMEGVLQEEPSSLQNLKESVFIKEEFKTPSEKPPLSLKKEISTIKAPVVQFARKNDPKLMINSQNNAKLPPVKQKKSIIRASTSNTSLPRNQLKLEKLKNVLDDMKIGKKELKKTVSASDHVKSFANAYEQRIIEDYNKLYSSKDRKLIFYQLKALERNKFLQMEMSNKELEMQSDKQKCNLLAYKIRNQEKKLFQLEETLEKINQQLPQDQITMIFEQKLKEEEDLSSALEREKITSDSLAIMCEDRKSLVLYIKKKCTEIKDELKDKNSKCNVFFNSQKKREEKGKELERNTIEISRTAKKFSTARLGPKFTDLLNDELSIFEEGRAVREIFRHEEELEKENERKAEEERRNELMKLKAKKDKEFDEIRKKRRLVEEELREKKQDFEKLRKVTQVPDVQKLPEHKDFLENCHQNMTFINEILSMEVALMKNDISDLDLELKKMKFDAKAGADQREMKLDDLEKVNIENVNSLEDMSNSVSKTERVIDEVCTSISRILYQLQGKNNKQRNVEVDRRNVLNSISVFGLKLERILTLLYKKKKDVEFESINTHAAYEVPPDFIGLNMKQYADFDDPNLEHYNDDEYINNIIDLEHEYFEQERKALKMTKEEKDRILKAQQKDQLKEEKLMKKAF